MVERPPRYGFAEQFTAAMDESAHARQERFAANKAARRREQLDPQRLAGLMRQARLKAGLETE